MPSPLRSRFFWKVYGSYVALVLITTALFGIPTARRLQRDAVADTEEQLHIQAALLRDIVLNDAAKWEAPAFQARITALDADLGTRITVIAGDGRVLADSRHDPASMENHAQRPEVLAAKRGGSGSSTRHSFTLSQEMRYVAIAVPDTGTPPVVVRTARATAGLTARAAYLPAAVGIGATAAVFLGLGIGLVFARRVTEPLSTMTAAAEALAEGRAPEQIRTDSDDEIGRLARAFTSMADQLQARMERLAGSRNEVLAILGSMVEGVVAVDREQRVMHMNRVAGTLLQATPEEAVGKPVWEVTRVQAVCDILANTIADGAGASGELRLVGRPRDRAIEMLASPLRDGDGHNAGAVVVLHDVTAVHRADVVRRDFVANVSHELKTPITAIRGVTETLLDDADMTPEAQERFLGKIHDQSMRLSTLVQDLLALARLETPEDATPAATFDVREPALASARALRAASEARGQALDTCMPETPVLVSGDAEALRQLVDNLVTNAQHYTPEGGLVRLDVQTHNGAAILAVADTGIGIESQHLDRIFERFYRVDTARSRELGGTGLGLSIVKHIALAHAGTVSVESTSGHGSTFRVELPLAPTV